MVRHLKCVSFALLIAQTSRTRNANINGASYQNASSLLRKIGSLIAINDALLIRPVGVQFDNLFWQKACDGMPGMLSPDPCDSAYTTKTT